MIWSEAPVSIPLTARIARYQAWLRRTPVDRPLIGLLWEADIPGLPAFLDAVGQERAIAPDEIDPAMFLPYIERWYQRDTEWQSDIIQSWAPAFSIPWVEAIADCPVVGYPGSLWAMPCLRSYAGRPHYHFDPHDPWLCKLLEFTQALVDRSAGRFPVALPQMRGPLDTLSSLRGAEQMSLDLLEQPAEVHAILAELADLWIEIARACLALIPPFHGGYVTRLKMWAPGPATTPQNDISTLISPRMYREFALPFDRRITAAFPYSSFHLHGSSQHQIPALLELPDLTALEVHLEHTVGGPSLSVMLPAARRILAQKPLLLVAPDLETADLCIRELPPAGLCVMVLVNAPELGPEYDAWLAGHHTRR
jgi:hypothetical protein